MVFAEMGTISCLWRFITPHGWPATNTHAIRPERALPVVDVVALPARAQLQLVVLKYRHPSRMAAESACWIMPLRTYAASDQQHSKLHSVRPQSQLTSELSKYRSGGTEHSPPGGTPLTVLSISDGCVST